MRTDLTRVRRRLVGVVILAVLATLGVTRTALAAGDPCVSGNAIACENSKTGNPSTEWDTGMESAGDNSIQGFATQMSATPGSTVQFKIKSAQAYTISIYRLGYYGGLGARKWAGPIAVSTPDAQVSCAYVSATQLTDCGTWRVSSQWAIPSNAVSGVYVAHLVQTNGNDSHITFVVRDDSSHSAVVFKTSDATWQAYNTYGGDADFYTAPQGRTETQARAFAVSYNRPLATRGATEGRDFLFSNEYPTLKFLERNGVDVSYTTDVDVAAGTTPLASHRAFLSVGHDEYWTQSERTNVETARDSGVNLMFLSGNEVYWHTRLAPSVDGSSTANRTLVCYKDTWEGRKIDPSSESTGTWRDPNIVGKPGGSNPENSLTGALYMSNNTDLPITVSAAEGKSRLWRNTSLASLASGASAALAPHTVGYESDEDVDNGARPPGLMHLSTVTGATPQYVQNAGGNVVAPGTTTHNLTLYRAASGALVFGAGTVQWGWGLDAYHDGDNTNPADARMQQATLNMLSDMGSNPTTLMVGLIQPTASTDTVAPTVVLSSPSAGASIANGSSVTVTGTASANGGVVTNVEVSLDGGATYHRATGTAAWSFTGVISGVGPSSIKVRASDDSANLSTPVSTAISTTCPCSLFGDRVPVTASTTDAAGVELGVKFTAATDGYVSAIRFYKGSANTGTHTGTLWSASGTPLGSGTFSSETASGWQTLTLAPAVAVTAATTYVASYFAPSGHYAGDSNYFSGGDYVASPLTAPGRPGGVQNGVYADGHGFPSSSFGDTNYWVDVLFTVDDTTPPSVGSRSPLPNSSSVARTAKVTGTFAGSVNPASIVMGLTTAGGASVPGTTTYDAPSRTAAFTPAAALDYGATYTASLMASSSSGVPMGSPMTWSFTVATTDPMPGACPCSLWPDSAVPAVASASDGASVQLGVKFTADANGTINGIRFYKGPLNLGAHTGSLWSSGGDLLGTVSFTGETSSGWQTAYFSSPITVMAGTTYLASYRAPSGGYSVTTDGLAAVVDSPPLHTLAPGGLYTYGSGAPLASSTANYWVDVVYTANDAAPTVSGTTPDDGSDNIGTAASPSATFAAAIQSGSARMAVKDGNGTPVDGMTTYTAASRTVSFIPTARLAQGTTYTVTVSAATALSGFVMTPYSWSFTTGGASVCPCTLFGSSAAPAAPDAGDASGVELGTSFTSSISGKVTGVRFFKSAANTGTHTGSLWSSAGSLLATGTFTGESASGWQKLSFATPVAVTSGTTYVVSYYAPNGHYAATPHFFDADFANGPLTAPAGNGLFRYGSSSGFPTESYGSTNYWVDVLFSTGTVADTTPPSVDATTPLASSSSQPASSVLTAHFTEPVTSPGIAFTLTDSSGTAAPGTVAYDAGSQTATYTPSDPLARGATYTATVTAADLAGNAMTTPTSWVFRIAQPDPTPGTCPCSVWTDGTTPASVNQSDSTAVELGVVFTSDASGSVTGVRFHKGPQNTGTHTASLWSAAGDRLATGTPAAESSSGWQTVSFPSPVTITAGTPYVVSYLAPAGHYSADASGLNAAVDSPPLHVLANGGRYVYGGGFPSNTSIANYWVDPVFTTAASPPDTTPPTASAVTAVPSGSTATVTWTTDEVSTSVVSYGITPSLGSTANGASGASHSVTLSGLAGATTYFYRVTSADAGGNSATTPAAAAPPATFQTVDSTPPTIGTVTATAGTNSATITWSTDESATSVVNYGSTSALGSTVTGASGTAHSVTLTALTDGATYFYRVASSDPSGNASTSPAPPATPATFVLADRTPPVVTAVAASGSATSATVSWTTNETSTSVVNYGTSATSLTSTATGATGTGHVVTLSGLTPSTRYYYRVTSADAAANATTSPATTGAAASYVPTVTPFSQTTAADFASGTLFNAYVSQTGDGEVMQTPSTGVEFTGTALPAGWTSTVLATGGTTAVSAGKATLSGTRISSTATATSPRSLEVSAVMPKNGRIGFGNSSQSIYAALGTNGQGQVVALAKDGGLANTSTVIPGVNAALPHRYRVDWVSTSQVAFVIDGVQVGTASFSRTSSLVIVLQDSTTDATTLAVDWLRVSPFTANGSYQSRIFDAGATVGWDTLSFTGSLPSGTTRTVQVRSGSTSTPGSGGWTAWATVATSGATITRSSRYLQYQVVMTSTGNRFTSSTTDSVQMAFHVL